MDLEDIKVLLRVVEFGSVQGAARHLGVPRSTLRRRLLNLEAQVGGDLLVADASGVVLTSAGAVIVEEGRLLLERSASMLSAAKASKDMAAGTLRLVLPVGLPNRLRVMMMQMLSAAAPGLCVDEREFADPLLHLHEPFEFLLHFGDPPAHGRWFSRVLVRDLAVPLGSEAYLKQRGRPTRIEDLANHSILSWRRPGSNPKEWPLLAGGTFPVAPYTISDNAELLHFAAQQGVGLVLGPTHASFHPEPTPLVPVLEREVGFELVLRSLSPVPEQADPRLRAVLTNIQSLLESLPTL